MQGGGGRNQSERLVQGIRACSAAAASRHATLSGDWLPDEMPVRSLCLRMVCTRWMIGVDVRRHHAFLADRFPNDSECLLTDLSVGSNIIWLVQVEFVDLILGYKLVDVDGALALDRDGLQEAQEYLRLETLESFSMPIT